MGWLKAVLATPWVTSDRGKTPVRSLALDQTGETVMDSSSRGEAMLKRPFFRGVPSVRTGGSLASPRRGLKKIPYDFPGFLEEFARGVDLGRQGRRLSPKGDAGRVQVCGGVEVRVNLAAHFCVGRGGRSAKKGTPGHA